MRNRVSWRRAGPAFGLLAILGGCAQGQGFNFMSGGGADDDPGINVRPANYRSEILAGMHAYLNDPTGIRDATMSEPMFKSVGGRNRYIVCLRFNGKQDNGMYAGDKLIAAEFLAGRFDDFLDVAAAREPCAGAVLTPFPELEQLKR